MQRALFALVLLISASACASTPSALTSTPPRTLPPAQAGLAGGGWTTDAADADWGVGYVRVSGGPRAVTVPLYDAPGGRQWGWLIDGRGYEADTRRAPPERDGARIRLGSGRDVFIATQERRGWVELRWGAPRDLRGGVGWTRLSAIRGGRARLVEWDQHFRRQSGLVFRNAAVAHNLRAGPGTDNPVITAMAGSDFDLEALELRGDWMRVRYVSPSACIAAAAPARRADAAGLLGGLEEDAGDVSPAPSRREQTGWIRWRSDGRGPWLRERSRGCARPVG